MRGMNGQWYFPLDHGCPEVEQFHRCMAEDPMNEVIPSDVLSDVTDDFERRHRKACARCREFGAANVEVIY